MVDTPVLVADHLAEISGAVVENTGIVVELGYSPAVVGAQLDILGNKPLD